MSLLGKLRNRAPVSYTSTKGSAFSVAGPVKSSRGQQLSAMGGNGTLFAIVDATSQGTASATWRLWRKAKSGRLEDRVEVTSHAALDCLNRPNDFFTRQEMFEAGQQHADLTGETWLVISRSPRSTVPLEVWPVRPDRMEPVASPTEYLVGYIYNGPDGEKIPLNLDEVIFMRRPNPEDPYRGIGPVQSVLTDLDAARYSAEWNKNFFLNSAEPGGVIEVDRRLSDDEFNEMRARWQEQHQGVAQAHRVALLEQGKWVDRKFSQRDMQFSELRSVSGEIIRQAFRFPVSMLGTSENVNRANAEAAEVVFGRWLLVPRLDRWKGALNNDFLPMFYPKGTPQHAIDLEFDYDRASIVPEDKEADAAQLKSKVEAAVALVGMGFDKAEVLEAVQLPSLALAVEESTTGDASLVAEFLQKVYLAVGVMMTADEAREMANTLGAGFSGGFTPPEPPPPAAVPGGDPEDPEAPPAPDDPDARLAQVLRASHSHPLLVAAEQQGPAAPDLGEMQRDWESKLDHLLGDFKEINGRWSAELLEQIREMAATGSLVQLLELKVDTASAASLLEAAMVELNQGAAHKVVKEAEAQGVKALASYTARSEISVLAQVIIAQLGAEIALSAGREAVRVSGVATSADDVVEKVGKHLGELTDARPRMQLGGALTAAQNSGRMATLLAAPVAAYYSSEILDGNTCEYCAAVNRRWLGNSLTEAQKLYPRAGYIDCKGGIRCRGTIVAVWRPEQSDDF